MQGIYPRAVLSWILLTGCANAIVRNERAGLVVEGPLAGPFDTPEGAVDALPLILERGGATAGNLGVEYCALIYRRPGSRQWYLSKLSNVVNPKYQKNGSKSCEAIDEVRDPAAGTVRILMGSNLVAGDVHNHTWPNAPTGFSIPDLENRAEWRWVIDVEGAFVPTIRLVILADGRRYKYELKSALIFKWDAAGRTWIRLGKFNENTKRVDLDDGMDW